MSEQQPYRDLPPIVIEKKENWWFWAFVVQLSASCGMLFLWVTEPKPLQEECHLGIPMGWEIVQGYPDITAKVEQFTFTHGNDVRTIRKMKEADIGLSIDAQSKPIDLTGESGFVTGILPITQLTGQVTAGQVLKTDGKSTTWASPAK
jgi:hypothetical protein